MLNTSNNFKVHLVKYCNYISLSTHFCIFIINQFTGQSHHLRKKSNTHEIQTSNANECVVAAKKPWNEKNPEISPSKAGWYLTWHWSYITAASWAQHFKDILRIARNSAAICIRNLSTANRNSAAFFVASAVMSQKLLSFCCYCRNESDRRSIESCNARSFAFAFRAVCFVSVPSFFLFPLCANDLRWRRRKQPWKKSFML